MVRKGTDSSSGNHNLEDILEQKAQLDSILESKFTKLITVMFTDLKGSTALTEAEGDMAVRLLIKQHNDIVLPIIEKNGKLVKTMGDGTMSYFDKPDKAITCAIEIQAEVKMHNAKPGTRIPIELRIGVHTGKGIVEANDIYGDVVNVASRFESIAAPGEVYFSHETFEALKKKDLAYIRLIKTVTLKGKSEPVKVYKAFYDEKEIEADKANPTFTVEEEIGASSALPTRLGMDAITVGTVPTLTVEIESDPKTVTQIIGNEFSIGRAKDNALVLDRQYISRKHCKLTLKSGVYTVEDTGSQLGFKVNGTKTKKQKLSSGDTITIGDIKLTFQGVARDDKTKLGMQAINAEDAGKTMAMNIVDIQTTTTMTAMSPYKLVVFHDDENSQEFPVTPEGLNIGRLDDNNIVLKDNIVSRKHARIWNEGSSIYLEDLGSNNGTTLNGKNIKPKKKTEIKEGDELGVCSYKIAVVGLGTKVKPEASLASLKSAFSGIFGKKKK